MNSFGLRNISNHPATDQLPAWSPDSRQLAFVSQRDGNSEIYVANLSSHQVQNVSMHSGQDTSPTWSPDGTRIAFESDRCCGLSISIADLTREQSYGLMPSDESVEGRQPTWSPDGGQIVFLRVGSDASNVFLDTMEVFAIDADGSNLRPFLDTGANESALIWSPNGQSLAVLLFLERGSEIYLADREGRQGHLLIYGCHALNENWTGTPGWSPDSEQLAFESECAGSSEIYIVDTNGDNLRRLTHNAARDSFPVWRP
jgi:TolB protein